MVGWPYQPEWTAYSRGRLTPDLQAGVGATKALWKEKIISKAVGHKFNGIGNMGSLALLLVALVVVSAHAAPVRTQPPANAGDSNAQMLQVRAQHVAVPVTSPTDKVSPVAHRLRHNTDKGPRELLELELPLVKTREMEQRIGLATNPDDLDENQPMLARDRRTSSEVMVARSGGLWEDVADVRGPPVTRKLRKSNVFGLSLVGAIFVVVFGALCGMAMAPGNIVPPPAPPSRAEGGTVGEGAAAEPAAGFKPRPYKPPRAYDNLQQIVDEIGYAVDLEVTCWGEKELAELTAAEKKIASVLMKKKKGDLSRVPKEERRIYVEKFEEAVKRARDLKAEVGKFCEKFQRLKGRKYSLPELEVGDDETPMDCLFDVALLDHDGKWYHMDCFDIYASARVLTLEALKFNYKKGSNRTFPPVWNNASA